MSHWLVSLSASIACQVFGYRPDTNWHFASLFVGWWPNICILFLIILFPLFLLFLIPFLFYYNLHFSCFFASGFPFCCSLFSCSPFTLLSAPLSSQGSCHYYNTVQIIGADLEQHKYFSVTPRPWKVLLEKNKTN